MLASIESLRALARQLYMDSELSLLQVAQILHLTEPRVARWSARDGGWSAQRRQRRVAARSPAAVRELLAEFGLLQRHTGPLRPGHLYFITITHNDACARLRGGACACVPDVMIERYQRPRARA